LCVFVVVFLGGGDPGNKGNLGQWGGGGFCCVKIIKNCNGNIYFNERCV